MTPPLPPTRMDLCSQNFMTRTTFFLWCDKEEFEIDIILSSRYLINEPNHPYEKFTRKTILQYSSSSIIYTLCRLTITVQHSDRALLLNLWPLTGPSSSSKAMFVWIPTVETVETSWRDWQPTWQGHKGILLGSRRSSDRLSTHSTSERRVQLPPTSSVLGLRSLCNSL